MHLSIIIMWKHIHELLLGEFFKRFGELGKVEIVKPGNTELAGWWLWYDMSTWIHIFLSWLGCSSFSALSLSQSWASRSGQTRPEHLGSYVGASPHRRMSRGCQAPPCRKCTYWQRCLVVRCRDQNFQEHALRIPILPSFGMAWMGVDLSAFSLPVQQWTG